MNAFDRRRAVIGATGIAFGGIATARLLPEEMLLRDRRRARSRVAIISALQYSEDLVDAVTRAIGLFKFDLRGKSVLLKPNLVEYIAGAEVNTNPVLVGAAAEAFLRLGAKRAIVAEGPGHQRDTYLVLVESGLDAQLRSQAIHFVDLNRDELVKIQTRANFTGLDHLWLPRTVLTVRLHCVHAQDQNTPLGWGHAEHEEHVRRCARHKIRMAQERPPLARDSSQHPGYLRNGADPLCDRGRSNRHGRQWTATRASSAPRENRSRQ